MLKATEKHKKLTLKFCDENDKSLKWTRHWLNLVSHESWLLSEGLSPQVRLTLSKWNG